MSQNNVGDNRKFISIAGMDDECNGVITRAVNYSNAENCESVGSVHIFLGILNTDIGESFLKNNNIDFESIYEEYQDRAKHAEYGIRLTEYTRFDPNQFSAEVKEMLKQIIADRSANGQFVELPDLIDGIIGLNSYALNKFTEKLGLNIYDLQDAANNNVDIPSELSDTLLDLNKEVVENPRKISGVDDYVNDMIEIMCRKLKANPCIIGEAGVGKTSIVYRLAQRINDGTVPKQLANKHIILVNSTMIVAGAIYRGMFEQRMSYIIDWAKQHDVILFLDEIHEFLTLNSNGNDATNGGSMIKSGLADGSLRIIGTTTNKEFHKYIEDDTAMTRRIQEIEIKEPSPEAAIKMIQNTIADYSDFHHVKISDKLIKETVTLSDRYIKNKKLPDKAYTIIDQAMAKAEISERSSVTENDILETISKLSVVDITKNSTDEKKTLINLESTLEKELIGQNEAVERVCEAVKRGKVGIKDPNKPIASFLFVGPTGVGKTELCKLLVKDLGYPKEAFIKIDMSEYKEEYSVSTLLGSSRGYVGSDKGGVLTEKIKHNPYSVVLFDEIEKADSNIFDVFLQLLDEGHITDRDGYSVDATNCIIVMTSNAGYGKQNMNKGTIGFATATKSTKTAEEKEKIAFEALESTFRPEFLNRVDSIVVFNDLTKEDCKKIARISLNKLGARLKEQGYTVNFDDSVVEYIADEGYSEKYGARDINRKVNIIVGNAFTDRIINDTLSKTERINVKYTDGKIQFDTEEVINLNKLQTSNISFNNFMV